MDGSGSNEPSPFSSASDVSEITLDEDISNNSNIFPTSGVDLVPSISDDATELAVNECSSPASLSRRARKRTDQCDTNAPSNPSIALPEIKSTADWAQAELQKRYCSETTSLVFGNVPVCAAYIHEVTGLFENVYGYLCK